LKYLVAIFLALVLMSCADARFYRIKGDMTADFRIKDAYRVILYTSANGYHGLEMTEDNNSWKTKIPAVSSFRYFLTVDGRTYLPNCPQKENDDFGGQICIYEER